MASKNEHLVPARDLRWYRTAKVPGLRNQLQQNNLPTDGRKYDLYQRLVDAGVKLYTDQRKNGKLDYDSDEESLENRRKRKRPNRRRADAVVHDGDDGDDVGNGDDVDAGDDQEPPRRRRKLVGSALPAELQDQLITTLHPSALWNLIAAAPDVYLSNDPHDINALRIEANHQRRHDHPARPPHAGPADGDGAPVDPDHDRPMSLLEWVGRRAVHDARFRTTNRSRIRRVIDTYVAAYQHGDPDAAPPDLGENPRDDILFYFRGGDTGDEDTPLGHAAADESPHVVQLLIAHGEDVNAVLNNRTALDSAMIGLGGHGSMADEARLQSVFALLGAGADLTVLSHLAVTEADNMILGLFGVPGWADNEDFEFPRIDNPYGLTAREFIADEHSSLFDRTLLAMHMIYYKAENYPYFV